jgi:hypothetical protein
MLVLSGFAESMRDQNDIVKGNKYEFNTRGAFKK